MGYTSIPRVGATYIDGAFRSTAASTQPKILILGTATRGLSYETFQVTDLSAAEDQFGLETEMMRVMHEVYEQGARNILLMRIGGKQGSIQIIDSSGNVLKITPEYRDNYILERYGIIIEPSSLDATQARLLIYDIVDLNYVYDSDEVKVLDEGIFTVEGIENWPVANVTRNSSDSANITSTDVVDGSYPAALPRLGETAAATLASAANLFSSIGSNAASDTLLTSSLITNAASVTKTAGTDGTDMPAVSRYACLEYAYQLLDFRDADIVLPCGVFHDMPNVAGVHEDGVASSVTIEVTAGAGILGGDTFKLIDSTGLETTYSADGAVLPADGGGLGGVATLGLSGVGTDAAAAEAIALAINQTSDANYTAYSDGVDKVIVTQGTDGTAGDRTNTDAMTGVTVGNFTGGVNGASWSNLSASSIDTAITQGNEKALPTAVSGVHPTMGASRADSGDAFLGYVWQYRYRGKIYTFFADSLTPGTANVIGPGELVGDDVPAAVYTRFNSATAAEFRECSFTHQLASFCHDASTNWSTMLGIVSTLPPQSFGRTGLRDRAGELPDYAILGSDRIIQTAAKNGVGLLGDKFLAGAHNYRNSAIDAASKDANDGLGRGGLILTTGSSLPNSEPYGILDTDEALDSNQRPIDIGKHILVTYDWPLIRSGYNGVSTYSNSLVGFLAGKLVTIPDNIEPIGVNGSLRRIVRTRVWNMSQVNDLAFIRAIGVRRDDTAGNIIVSCKTAAHPTSDYSRLSTIRCVNRTLSGIRAIAAPYIGTPFSSTRLLSLQQAIDGYLKEERTAGFNQGAKCTMSYSRADKIIGKLTLRLKMIPPFSIDTIIVETSLAAEESELS